MNGRWFLGAIAMAEAKNDERQEFGVVGQGGEAFVSGLPTLNGQINVHWILVFVLTLLLSPCANAGINCGDSGANRTMAWITMPATKIAADAPVGTVIWKAGPFGFSTTCGKYFLQGGVNAGFFRQDLVIPGSGLAYYVTYRDNTGSGPATIDTGIFVDQYGSVTVSGAFGIELRKIGATPTDGTVSGSSMHLFGIAGLDSSGYYSWLDLQGLSNISFVTYTCSVDASSLNKKVNMGDMRVDKFTGIGSTSPDHLFSIGLTCSQPAGSYTVTIKFDATADTSKAPGVLALDSGADAATGVGIQLLMNSTPVTFGTALSVGSATAGATLSVPLTARYYQTAASIKPGKANGIATFTISYK
jgi:major type 1 subunit fimbrin (pilin)